MAAKHWTYVAIPPELGGGFKVWDELSPPEEPRQYEIPAGPKSGVIAERVVEVLNFVRDQPIPRSAAGNFYSERRRRK